MPLTVCDHTEMNKKTLKFQIYFLHSSDFFETLVFNNQILESFIEPLDYLAIYEGINDDHQNRY